MCRDKVSYWKSELGHCRRKHHNSHWRQFCKRSVHKAERAQAREMLKAYA